MVTNIARLLQRAGAILHLIMDHSEARSRPIVSQREHIAHLAAITGLQAEAPLEAAVHMAVRTAAVDRCHTAAVVADKFEF